METMDMREENSLFIILLVVVTVSNSICLYFFHNDLFASSGVMVLMYTHVTNIMHATIIAE